MIFFHNHQILLETSFLFPELLSPLRNRLPNITRPSIDNFERPLTRIIDDKTNTIEVTPKKPTRDINLQDIFPNVNEVIKEDSEKSKEKI